MLLIIMNIKKITKETPTYKFSATITTPHYRKFVEIRRNRESYVRFVGY